MSILPSKLTELRAKAELILSATDSSTSQNSIDDIRSALFELDTYRIELELQNEELLNTYQHLQYLHQDYLNLYNFAPVAYLTLDRDGVICNANHSLSKFLGLTKQQLQKTKFTDYILPDDQDIFYFYQQALLDQQQVTECKFRLLDSKGNIIWVNCQGFLIVISAAKEINFVFTDITQLIALEDDLRLGASIFDESEEAIMIASADLILLKVNQAFTLMTGYTKEEVIGKKTNLLKSGKQDDVFYQAMWVSINQTNKWQGEILNKRKNGEIYPEWLNIVARRNSVNSITHYIGIFSDITLRKNAESRIHYMAYYDALTQLPNRTMLQDRINYATARSQHSGKYNALMLLDLDHFKVINDSLGHGVGDRLLIEVAQRLKKAVREEDTVARLGGDEFVILLFELSLDQQVAEQNAVHIAEKICKKLAEPIIIAQKTLHISVSIGITLFVDESDSSADLIKNADNAMYKAKDAGRNKYQLFSAEMKLSADSRLIIENELRNALLNNELELYYQPQTHILNNTICSAEALLRWHHPNDGLISPTIFIPIAEQTGLIIALGTWVLKTACQQMADWQTQIVAKGIDYIAVNVSPHQFQQKDFVNIVINSVTEAGITPDQLEIELTEGVLMQNVADTRDKLQALKAFGIRIAIDDFGTGYSSLNYLKSFPLDTLKIDQSFVRDITHDSSDAAIVQTIIALANNLNLHVMAEGVETEAQLAFLRERKCDSYQGYLTSRPLPHAEFIKFLTVMAER